jgi:hypothetical protein
MDLVNLWNRVWWVWLYIHVLPSWVVTPCSTDRPEDRGRGSSMCTVLHDVTAQNTTFCFLIYFWCRFCTYWCCPLKEPCLPTRVCAKLCWAASGFVSSPDWQVSGRNALSSWWEIYMFLLHLTVFTICLLTYLLTYRPTDRPTELSPSWEAASCAATQELPSILWNLKVHHHVHKSPSLIPILSRQLCSYSRPSQHFKEPEGSSPCSQEPSTGPYPEPDRPSPQHPILSKIYFNIVHPPTSWSS